MTRVRGRAPPTSSWPFMIRTVPGCKHSEGEGEGGVRPTNKRCTRCWQTAVSLKLTHERLSCRVVLHSLRQVVFPDEAENVCAKKCRAFCRVIVSTALTQSKGGKQSCAPKFIQQRAAKLKPAHQGKWARIQEDKATSGEASRDSLTSYM